MTVLRKKMEDDLGLRSLAPGTRNHYLGCVRRFAEYFWQSPAQLGTQHVRQYLQHLGKLGRKPATIVLYWAALLFVYKVTLGRPEVMRDVPRPRVPGRAGVVALTEAEVAALFDWSGSPFGKTLYSVMYACGLRVSEACALQVGDIDTRAGLIHIRKGKGNKVRSVRLSPMVLEMLRQHWRLYRPPEPWLFPARRLLRPGVIDQNRPWADHPVSRATMSQRFRVVRQRAGLKRRVTLHDFRRAYATRLREAGVDLRDIQVVLGHSSPETTARYVSVSPELIKRLPCPLERLG
jgi:integrase/recombinase XerD